MERLEELGIEDFPVLEGDYSYRSGFDLADKLANSKGGPPDALICANDVMAIGAIDAMRTKHGLNAPEDISVVGFDGVGPSGWESYKVTTIRQPVRRMVEATVSLMMSMIEDPQATHEKRVFSGMLQRGNSARMQDVD
jgi:DNA-binding LacI/PurR family transcriptional regulator